MKMVSIVVRLALAAMLIPGCQEWSEPGSSEAGSSELGVTAASHSFSRPTSWASGIELFRGDPASEAFETLADVNGDGRKDVVGFGRTGVWLALSNGASFAPRFDVEDFGYDSGWRVGLHVRLLGDVNGDHLDDIVGFGRDGVWVSVSTGSGFAAPSFAIGDFGYNQAWRIESDVRLLADVNGDGRKDILGFGIIGVWMSLSTSEGFTAPALVVSDFGREQGWDPAKHIRTAADVNGDGRDDIVAFGRDGVWIALSNGSGFDAPQFVLADFGFLAGGWTIDHPRLMADMNQDGRDDIVGFGNDGVWIVGSVGGGFGPPQLVLSDFGLHSLPAWTSPGLYPRFVADVNGDQVPDVVGFGPDAVYRALGGPAGPQPPAKLLRDFVVRLGTSARRLVGDVNGDGKADLVGLTPSEIQVALSADVDAPARVCPATPEPHVVEIREADPNVDRAHHDEMRARLMDSVGVANTTILLGPNVVLDFSDVPEEALPLRLGPCVTLTSASGFGSPAEMARPARTPSSLGPLLRFGPHRSDTKAFLDVICGEEGQANDNVRISGFRLFGPSFGQQQDFDIGIKIFRCLNIEVSNMEIAGWGGQGVHVEDTAEDQGAGPGQEQPNNLPGERIGRPEEIRIFGNYIHHNQHPRTTFNSHTAGYGVEVNHGAWAQVYENVFDSNRHALMGAGDSGGYEASRNLVLKGGGVHYEFLGIHTHQFDIHGTGDNGFGGQASVLTSYADNSFQYLADNAIGIRGRPLLRVDIHDNIFAHEGLEDDEGDDAIAIDDRDNLDVIFLGPNNEINFDSYGKYGVCDFDGDGVDDVFLPTGRTWWYSSYGEFAWSYLSTRTERLPQIRLGYFDADLRCDVLTQSGDDWVISSGGTGPWQSIGSFGAPLDQVAFGQFDPNVRDHRPGATRRTTHAFQRRSDGQWFVTPLSAPAWEPVQSSSFPMSSLRFGDFTGDGVTDVLAVQAGRWSISESARGGWRNLNPQLADNVSSLFIADLNNNNIDDLIRLTLQTVQVNSNTFRDTYTWWVSDDGRSGWRAIRSYAYLRATTIRPPAFGFAGRFGAAPGGGVLLVDSTRTGRFFSPAEVAAGASPDWNSLFSY